MTDPSKVTDVHLMNRESGLPLRQFVRGFLRDHMGMSKIAAHLMADLFMDRWGKRDAERTARYAREDQHTLAATFTRQAVTEVDKAAGMTKAVKAEIQKDLDRSKDAQVDANGGQLPRKGLRPPNKLAPASPDWMEKLSQDRDRQRTAHQFDKERLAVKMLREITAGLPLGPIRTELQDRLDRLVKSLEKR